GNASVDHYLAETLSRTHLSHDDLPAIDKDTPPGCQPLVDCALDDLSCDRSCDTGTPTMDWLAARGAIFPVGYVSHPRCIESFRSTLSGLYTTQFFHDEGGEDKLGEFTVPAGYITFGYGKVWQRSYRELGFDVGETMRAAAEQRAKDARSSPDRAERRSRRDYRKLTVGGDRTKTNPRRGLGALAKFWDIYYDAEVYPDPAERQPWMVWYSPRLPHAPYRHGKPFIREQSSDFGGSALVRGTRVYGNIRFLDTLLHDLFTTLDGYGGLDNTIVLYQSDHGFLLPGSKKGSGENGYRSVILASGPGITPGTVLPQLVHAVDFLPTIMDYACEGIPVEQCKTNPQWRGQSMRPLLEPTWSGTSPFPPEQNGAFQGRRYVFSPKISPLRHFVRSFDGYRMSKKLGAIDVYQLFDIFADPDERTPITREQMPEIWDRLQDQIDNHIPDVL
ncbi:MAG: arylsulfatase A-like enzyme, partial [Candidatus Binatia bacterium]